METRDLSTIVKAYDVRGLVPEEFDEPIARDLGAAFAQVVSAPAVVTAHDMRESSVPLSRAFAEGVLSQGVDVVETGLGSTDMLYFASGSLDLPGAMFTASHNPAQYNGIKLCRAGATPIGADTGLREIQRMAEAGPLQPGPRLCGARTQDMLLPYADFLRGLVDLRANRPLSVVVDAGNGMGGYTVPAVLADLPLTVIPMFFELDGSCPHH
ncbi:MAG: hypothetical protein ACR2J5_18510 [Geodermatophilaceae bacterium]